MNKKIKECLDMNLITNIGAKWYESIQSLIMDGIPEERLECLKLNVPMGDSIVLRYFFIDNFNIFGLPTLEFIKDFSKIVNGRTVYDFGCGVGYLTYLLNKNGVKARGVDNYSTEFSFDYYNHTLFNVDVKEEDAVEFSKSIKDSVVVINWPDYKKPFAHDICKSLDFSNQIYYMGERKGGCTADDSFFDSVVLEFTELSWFQWPGIHDSVYRVLRY